MKRLIFLALLCLALSAQAQNWNYVMHQGDVLVYQDAVTKNTSIVRLSVAPRSRIQPDNTIDMASVYVYNTQIPRYFYCDIWSCITDVRAQGVDGHGIVYQTGRGLEATYRQMYPTFVPPRDTLFLHYKEKSDSTLEATYGYSMFDTTILGADVRALSFTHVHGDTVSNIIVSEIFGYVQIRNKYEDWRLSSAIIGGRKYNRDPRKFAAFDACAGAVF